MSLYDLFMMLASLCMVAIPVLVILFIVQWIRKKTKLWFGLSVLFCIVGVTIFGAIGMANMTPEERAAYEQQLEKQKAEKEEKKRLEAEQNITESQEKEKVVCKDEPQQETNGHSSKQPSESDSKITVETTKKPDPVLPVGLIAQFKGLGFTDVEAQKMKEIFTTVGVTEISNIQKGAGTGIDNLQTFKCDIFDYHAAKGGLSVHFTIENRHLCYISLDGIPTTKVDYFYINIFGNVKTKTSNSKESVVLFDLWDENGEIIENGVGYKAVFDYKNSKIIAYEQ